MSKPKNSNLSSMTKRLLWIALFFLVVALVFSMIAQKKAAVVKAVEVSVEPLEGYNFLMNDEDVLLTIERSFGFPLETMRLGSVDIARVERVLKEEPFVLAANVFVDAENIVKISITQRAPVLRVIDNNGFNYYLDKDAFKMPLSKHFSARVLVASGNIPPFKADFQKRKKHILKDLFELAQKIRADEFLQPMIEQIHVNKKNELTLVPKVGKQKIIFGKYTSVDDKLKRLKIFYTEAMPYEGWRKYKTIDLKYKGQVVAK